MTLQVDHILDEVRVTTIILSKGIARVEAMEKGLWLLGMVAEDGILVVEDKEEEGEVKEEEEE